MTDDFYRFSAGLEYAVENMTGKERGLWAKKSGFFDTISYEDFFKSSLLGSIYGDSIIIDSFSKGTIGSNE